MLNLNKQGSGANHTLLPQDYIDRKADRRANLIYLTLFSVVIFGVTGAFFVTNQQWSSVKKQQGAINQRYAQAAKDIEQLKELEEQQKQKYAKADLTSVLIEKAPRSVVLAELINRMPEHLTLLEFELMSKRIESRRISRSAQNAKSQSLAAKANKNQKTDQAAPEAPRYNITISIVGVAASHSQVAWYVSALQDCNLLEQVDLKFSEKTIIDDRGLNKFRIEAKLRENADARSLDLSSAPRASAFGADGKKSKSPGTPSFFQKLRNQANAADDQEN